MKLNPRIVWSAESGDQEMPHEAWLITSVRYNLQANDELVLPKMEVKYGPSGSQEKVPQTVGLAKHVSMSITAVKDVTVLGHFGL